MATVLTTQAIEGYRHEDGNENRYIATSPAWYGFRAGKALRDYGVSAPVKATMGRGSTVNLWTAATRFRVTLEDYGERVERINE